MDNTDYMEVFDRKMDRKTYPAAEQLAILRRLGLDISQEAADCANEEREFTAILEKEGFGVFEGQQLLWAPSSKQVYAFDAEVVNIETMYCDYIRGLQAISEGELTFTDVVQDDQQVNWDEPSGVVVVRFCLNGTACQFEAEFQGDWLDVNVLDSINSFLEKLGVEKRFYYMDGSCGEIIFFCTRAWASEFETSTDCYMSTSHTR